MDNVLLRFPHLGEQIFKKLEDSSLANCHQLSRTGRLFIEDQKFLWIRIIKKLCDDQPTYIDRILVKINSDSIRNAANNVREFCRINLSISRGQGLLHIAAMSGEIDIVEKILTSLYGLIPNQTDNRGRTPLHFAAINGHFEVFKLIWKYHAEKKHKNKKKNPQDHMELTPLHFAAQMGHVEICKFIFTRLKCIGSTKRLGLTPLHFAAEHGHLEVCRLFINDQKCETKSGKMIDRLEDKNPRCEEGKTPLHLAAKSGHLNVCQFIIGNVQDKNPKDNRKDTPLHVAAEKGHFDVCEWIIGQFVDKIPININPLNLYGETPLQNAFLHRHDRIYELISQSLGYSKKPSFDVLVNESLPKKSRVMLQVRLDVMKFEEDRMDPDNAMKIGDTWV